MICLFVGRFQPLHKGHEAAIKSLFRKCSKVVIVIGSSNKKDKENPFTLEQRKKMIKNVFSKFRKKYSIIGIPDIGNDYQWAMSIMKKAEFDVVVTGNAWTRRCFRQFKIRVIKPRMLKPRTYDASRIRKMIRENKQWQKLVPEQVAKIIE